MPELLPNYFFIGSIVHALFLAYCAQLLFRMPKRSAASTQLAVVHLISVFFSLSYAATHGFYTLPNFFVRWLNFYTALAAALHAAAFFHAFPTVRSPRTLRLTLILGHAVILLVTAYLAIGMANAPLYYLFNSHFWDSDTLPLQKIASLVILAYFLHFCGVGLWRGFVERGAPRRAVWLIAAAYFLATVPSGVLQVLSRDNLVERSFYMTSFVILNLLGYFCVIVVYINVTQDRSSILGRITGISLLTVLLICQAAAFFWLNDAERNYDSVRYARAREGYALGQLPDAAALQVVYERKSRRLQASPALPDYGSELHIEQEAQATYLLRELSALPGGANLGDAARALVREAQRYSPIQVAYLERLVTARHFADGEEMARAVLALRRRQLYMSAKLQQMTGAAFAKMKGQTIAELDKSFPGFAAGTEGLENREDAQVQELLIRALVPWRAEGERLYRGEKKFLNTFPRHFVAYQFVDRARQQVVEVGYPYRDYRATVARSAWPLIFTILAAYLLVLIGFPRFFRGALMRPISAIVDGLKEINNNNFTVRVKLKVEDEIGFMARSFNKMARSIQAGRMRLQKYAEQLERKVKERTHELQATLEDVQTLKEQQDGDYFLTTLLLKPLGINEVDSRFIGVESFVQQKKKFQFRHWSTDIGGDINISHIIELQGKRYVACINGDAMGKSIQGAGGALVLGSVFHTIIERTQATSAMRDLSPERWLKNAFVELHRVFESFDGSMLVAGFFGIIDEKTGLVYHLTAEHPRPVLLRDGKATFVDNDRLLRKLGTTGLQGTLAIATTQLEPGDVIFLGSDGRDDIILGYDKDGGRIINEDESLFVRLVEEANGSMKDLVDLIEKHGEIMDDLSLMRIERFREEHAVKRPLDYAGVLEGVKRDVKAGDSRKAIARIEAYLRQDEFYPEAVKNLAQIHYQIRDYRKAAGYAQDYILLKPSDKDFVFFAALCFRKTKDYRRAIDLAERLRLRELPLGKNLALLTELHLKVGNLKRAESIFSELTHLEPDHGSIEILRRKLAAASRSS